MPPYSMTLSTCGSQNITLSVGSTSQPYSNICRSLENFVALSKQKPVSDVDIASTVASRLMCVMISLLFQFPVHPRMKSGFGLCGHDAISTPRLVSASNASVMPYAFLYDKALSILRCQLNPNCIPWEGRPKPCV